MNNIYIWIKDRIVNAFEDLCEKLIFTFIGITIYYVLLLTPVAIYIDATLGLGIPSAPNIGVLESNSASVPKAATLPSQSYFNILGIRSAFAENHVETEETAQINAARSTFQTTPNVVVGNDYKYIGRSGLLRRPTWCWKIYIKDTNSLPYIRSVTYDYRGWFTNETINKTPNNNLASGIKQGWGVFPVRVTITYKNGSTEHAEYNLSFSNKDGGHGSEDQSLCL